MARSLSQTLASVAVTAAGAMAVTSYAGAATPTQHVGPAAATRTIAACLSHTGATRVDRHGAHGGAALYPRAYVKWSYITRDGSVIGTITGDTLSASPARLRLTHSINACLRPFNGHV